MPSDVNGTITQTSVHEQGLHLYGRLRGFAARKRESLALANRFYRETYLQP